MNLASYTFVALDLETTGLSHEKDTIIECAAVRFQLIKKDGKYLMQDQEERTMLIDPERALTDEIRMITGISDEMLVGRKKWGEVRENVREFIGESIIVGHNVLFDTAMLATHGIDLSANHVLDTFELSEIFSQEAESLNLGFLGKHYRLDIESEHRALDDTKLSIELFLEYMNQIESLEAVYISIFELAARKDISHTIETLLAITEKKSGSLYSNPQIFQHSNPQIFQHSNPQIFQPSNIPTLKYSNPQIFQHSLTGDIDEELRIIGERVQTDTLPLLITDGYKQSTWIAEQLKKSGKQPIIYREAEKFISPEIITAFLEKLTWTRKETILMVKFLFWIETTETGLLDELKYYGDERLWLPIFRATPDESNAYIQKARAQEKTADILISDSMNSELLIRNLRDDGGVVILRDAMSLEKNLRKQNGKKISFTQIYNILEGSEVIRKNIEIFDTLLNAFSIIQGVIEGVVVRPTGPDPLPPGEFGETYIFTQSDLWHRGGKWLPLSGDLLRAGKKILETEIFSALEYREITPLREALSVIIELIHISDANLSLICHIGKDGTNIQIFHRDITAYTKKLLTLQGASEVLVLGYGIDGPMAQRFLAEECGLDIPTPIPYQTKPSHIEVSRKIEVLGEKTVILGTNLKALRELTTKLKNTGGIETIYTQGLSGGKGKILSLFKRSEKKTVLIGLIDTWKDESELWEEASMVHILKVPFDPPSDPYFIARTTGMTNNFDSYSAPLALNTINTLIGRIRSANKNVEIRIYDDRLEKNIWGKEMQKYILPLTQP